MRTLISLVRLLAESLRDPRLYLLGVLAQLSFGADVVSQRDLGSKAFLTLWSVTSSTPAPAISRNSFPTFPILYFASRLRSCVNREDTGACDVQEAPAAIGTKSKPNLSPNCRLALAETRLPQPSVQQQRRPERSLVGGQGTRGRTHSQSLQPVQGQQSRLAAAQFQGRQSWQRAMHRVPVAGTGALGHRFRPPRKCLLCRPVETSGGWEGEAIRKEAGQAQLLD